MAADFSATWLNGDGNWSDATQWDTNPNYPNNGNGVTYDATINDGNVALDQDITIQRFFFNGGNLSGAFNLTLNEGLTWTGSTSVGFDGVTINLAAGSSSTISDASFTVGTTVNNSGLVSQSGGGGFNVINNLAGATWTWSTPAGSFDTGQETHVNNSGNFVVHGNFLTFNGFDNSGTVTNDPGDVLVFTQSAGTASGTFNVGQLAFNNVDYSFTAGATVNASVTSVELGGLHVTGNSTINSDLFIASDGFVDVEAGATLTFTGNLSWGSNASDYIFNAVHLSGGTIESTQPLTFQSGGLTGFGTVNGDVSSNATISPGGTRSFPTGYENAPGALSINGNLSLLNDSTIIMEIGGLSQGIEYDYLVVGEIVALDGTLELRMINGFQMQLADGQTFTLLTSEDAITGAFDNVANGDRLVTADGTASFQVNYGPGSPFGEENLVLSDPQLVPEPATMLLLLVGAGLVGFARFRRRSG